MGTNCLKYQYRSIRLVTCYSVEQLALNNVPYGPLADEIPVVHPLVVGACVPIVGGGGAALGIYASATRVIERGG